MNPHSVSGLIRRNISECFYDTLCPENGAEVYFCFLSVAGVYESFVEIMKDQKENVMMEVKILYDKETGNVPEVSIV
jgi:hypothetical protein